MIITTILLIVGHLNVAEFRRNTLKPAYQDEISSSNTNQVFVILSGL